MHYNKISVENFEKDTGIDITIFIKAIKHGIWSREHLHLPNKHFRQDSPYPVMPTFKDGTWYFLFNPTSPCADSAYGPAHIFWDRVEIRDMGKTWSIYRKDMEGKEGEDA